MGCVNHNIAYICFTDSLLSAYLLSGSYSIAFYFWSYSILLDLPMLAPNDQSAQYAFTNHWYLCLWLHMLPINISTLAGQQTWCPRGWSWLQQYWAWQSLSVLSVHRRSEWVIVKYNGWLNMLHSSGSSHYLLQLLYTQHSSVTLLMPMVLCVHMYVSKFSRAGRVTSALYT